MSRQSVCHVCPFDLRMPSKLGKKVLTKVKATSIIWNLLWKAANLGPPDWVSEEWVHDRPILRPALCDDAKTPDKQVYTLVNT